MLLGQQIHMNQQWLNIKRIDYSRCTKYSKTNEKNNKQTNNYGSRKWIEITLSSALHSLRCEMNRPAFYIDRDVEIAIIWYVSHQ
jgi:hypothetical protein